MPTDISAEVKGTGGLRRRIIPFTLAIAAFAIVYILVDFLVLSSFARIMVEMEGPVSSSVKAYYSTSVRHEAFSENQVTTAVPYPGGKRVTLRLDLENRTVKKLRLDPGEVPGIYKIYSLSLLSFFGKPVKVVPYAADLEIKGGPGTVVSKKADYLEISAQTDDPSCIISHRFAVPNPYFRFGVPLVFALLTLTIAQRVRLAEFLFWRDVRGKKSSTGVNYQALDGLRGLAAFLVLVDHTGVPGCNGIGMIGVVMFFCLSGFLLTIPFAKNGAKIIDIASVQSYFLRRVRRIAPMFYAIIFTTYFFDGRIEDTLRSALFLQGNSIYWTVLQEMHFYLLLPIVMLCNHLLLRDTRWLIVLFLLVLSFAFDHSLVSTYKVYGLGQSQTLYAGLFLGGMMTCFLFHMPGVRESQILKKLCGNHFLTLALFVGVLLADHLWSFAHGGQKVGGDWVLLGNFNYLVAALVFVLVMSESSCVAWVLRALPLRLLGLVSYSFYLFHPIFIKAVKYLSQNYLYINIGNIGTCVVVLVTTLLVSTVTYTFIERPFIFFRERS
ncbi:MAG: acyltransferase [Pseudomonadota bacterium]